LVKSLCPGTPVSLGTAAQWVESPSKVQNFFRIL
jgi:hypothetical protein